MINMLDSRYVILSRYFPEVTKPSLYAQQGTREGSHGCRVLCSAISSSHVQHAGTMNKFSVFCFLETCFGPVNKHLICGQNVAQYKIESIWMVNIIVAAVP